jgi:actin-related protein
LQLLSVETLQMCGEPIRSQVEAELVKYDGPEGASMYKAHALACGAATAACGTTATAAPGGGALSVRAERFLAPELLFAPSLSAATSLATPLPTLIDEAVQACPIDFRRALYGNVVLAGGTMGLRNLRTRLQYAVQVCCAHTRGKGKGKRQRQAAG